MCSKAFHRLASSRSRRCVSTYPACSGTKSRPACWWILSGTIRFLGLKACPSLCNHTSRLVATSRVDGPGGDGDLFAFAPLAHRSICEAVLIGRRRASLREPLTPSSIHPERVSATEGGRLSAFGLETLAMVESNGSAAHARCDASVRTGACPCPGSAGRDGRRHPGYRPRLRRRAPWDRSSGSRPALRRVDRCGSFPRVSRSPDA